MRSMPSVSPILADADSMTVNIEYVKGGVVRQSNASRDCIAQQERESVTSDAAREGVAAC